jgi:signal transduction histidine kinase
VQVGRELAMTRDLAAVVAIVARTARELTRADGATVVLREADQCYYADEDAIAPLWKGQRFPLDRCVSGWAMQHREIVVVDDVYADARAPIELYRPTFVQSLAMVPIHPSPSTGPDAPKLLDGPDSPDGPDDASRPPRPSGAIGIYWALPHHASQPELSLLQSLADSTATAMANVAQWAGLESHLTDRATQLEAANDELEAFSYAVSHDLRAPLRAIAGFSKILLEDHAPALGAGRRHLDRIRAATRRMTVLIDDLLRFSQMAANDLDRRAFDLAHVARDIVDDLRSADPTRRVEVTIPAALPARGDARLVRVVLENLLGNAWKFTSKRQAARIEVGVQDGAFFVRDNGAGFDPTRADKLFAPFHRLHNPADFEGTGVGLATAQRIVHRHGGRIWAQSTPDHGATFHFTLG